LERSVHHVRLSPFRPASRQELDNADEVISTRPLCKNISS
jgi:hypothetical protein